jgi:hypothetical protein
VTQTTIHITGPIGATEALAERISEMLRATGHIFHYEPPSPPGNITLLVADGEWDSEKPSSRL